MCYRELESFRELTQTALRPKFSLSQQRGAVSIFRVQIGLLQLLYIKIFVNKTAIDSLLLEDHKR